MLTFRKTRGCTRLHSHMRAQLFPGTCPLPCQRHWGKNSPPLLRSAIQNFLPSTTLHNVFCARWWANWASTRLQRKLYAKQI